jgi:hypothetical protein
MNKSNSETIESYGYIGATFGYRFTRNQITDGGAGVGKEGKLMVVSEKIYSLINIRYLQLYRWYE